MCCVTHCFLVFLGSVPSSSSRQPCHWSSLHAGHHRYPWLVSKLCVLLQDFYKAVVARNPVVDVVSVLSLSDIPDWWVIILVILSLRFLFPRLMSSHATVQVYGEIKLCSGCRQLLEIESSIICNISTTISNYDNFLYVTDAIDVLFFVSVEIFLQTL